MKRFTPFSPVFINYTTIQLSSGSALPSPRGHYPISLSPLGS